MKSEAASNGEQEKSVEEFLSEQTDLLDGTGQPIVSELKLLGVPSDKVKAVSTAIVDLNRDLGNSIAASNSETGILNTGDEITVSGISIENHSRLTDDFGAKLDAIVPEETSDAVSQRLLESTTRYTHTWEVSVGEHDEAFSFGGQSSYPRIYEVVERDGSGKIVGEHNKLGPVLKFLKIAPSRGIGSAAAAFTISKEGASSVSPAEQVLAPAEK